MLTGASSLCCVRPLRPGPWAAGLRQLRPAPPARALGGWPEAAAQLWGEGAPAPVPESCSLAPCTGSFVRMLGTHFSPLAWRSGQLLPLDRHEEPGRFFRKAGGRSAVGSTVGPARSSSYRPPAWGPGVLCLAGRSALVLVPEPCPSPGHRAHWGSGPPSWSEGSPQGKLEQGSSCLTQGSTLALCLTSFSGDPMRDRVRALTGRGERLC